MLVVLVAGLVAAVVISAGGVRHLSRLHVRAVWLLVAAAALQVAPAALAPTSGWLRLGAGALSVALVALFLAGNMRVAGVPLIAAGLMANVSVMVANGAMPVSTAGAERIGLTQTRLRLDEGSLREPLTGATWFAPLADRIPLALPWYPQVVSVGDVLVASGVALMLVSGAARPHAPVPERRKAPHVREAAQKSAREERMTACDNESTTRGSYS